jgi:hypothetical protein
MLRELRETIQDSDEFIRAFKALALRLDLPGRDVEFASLDRAESLLLSRLEIARQLANRLNEGSESAEAEGVHLEIAAAVGHVRRARLFLQLKIFRLDRTLERVVRELKSSISAAEQRNPQHLTRPHAGRGTRIRDRDPRKK